MAETKKSPKRKVAKRTYVHRPNALCVTIHSQDGSPVPTSVRNEAADAIWQIAQDHNLLINLADT